MLTTLIEFLLLVHLLVLLDKVLIMLMIKKGLIAVLKMLILLDTTDLINTGIFRGAYDEEDEGAEADLQNLETTMTVVYLMARGPLEPKWVFRNKKDDEKTKRGIVVRNKARLVAHGYTHKEGIDYDEVFTPVARIEAIMLFLAYASFMGFIVYQMDVKSAFLYCTIEEEVYVCQPHGFEDSQFPDKVYKVEKALYGLHQAPRAWKTSNPICGLIWLCLKDEELEDVRIGSILFRSLMYLIASMPDIMFDVCAYARFQVTSKVSHLHAVKRIFRYLKSQHKLGLWYPRDSPFDLEAFLTVIMLELALIGNPKQEVFNFLANRMQSPYGKAIRNRFGDQTESIENAEEPILKRIIEKLCCISQDGLDKSYDRDGVDANAKLLRSLPSAWNNIALIMRNKSDPDTLSMNDLYNNLKVYEYEIKGKSSSNSNSHNVAFVSSNNSSSTNEIVNTAQSVFAASSKDLASTASYANDVMFSFFANQSNAPQLDYEDLKQIDDDDLKEMDLKWKVAMLSMRVKRFIKKTRRKMNLNDKEIVGFDRTKDECYNCHRRGHFARECMALRNQGNRNRDAPRRNAPVDTSTTNDLVVQDGIGGYDWSFQAEEGI
ncbi:ribonuclease H-like domain-containing protein [Tanacetum coccineum]